MEKKCEDIQYRCQKAIRKGELKKTSNNQRDYYIQDPEKDTGLCYMDIKKMDSYYGVITGGKLYTILCNGSNSGMPVTRFLPDGSKYVGMSDG